MFKHVGCTEPRRWQIISRSIAVICAMTICGCSRHHDAARSARATDDSGLHGLSPDRYKQAQGYSLLYEDADDVTKFQLEFKIKNLLDAIPDPVKDFIDYDSHLKGQLERLAKDYPGVRIDLPARSDIEEQERRAIGKDYLLAFAPLVGDSGAKFQRKALLFFIVFVDTQSHLTAVMASQETDPKLKSFLQQQHQTLVGIYKRFNAVLNRTYFTHPDTSG